MALINVSDDSSLENEDTEVINEQLYDDATHILYDTNTKPTWIESMFGEPYHVNDKYSGHQITISLVITLASVYFVEGYQYVILWTMTIGISHINHIKDMDKITIMFNISWSIKILYGLIIDRLPLFGYKRKSYMILLGIIACLSGFIVIVWSTNYYIELILMTINIFSITFCDVIADALTVERTELKSHAVATSLQSLELTSKSIALIVGILISTQIKTSDMLYLYWFYIFALCFIPISALFLTEKRRRKKNNQGTLCNDDSIELIQKISDHSTYPIKRIIYLVFETLCRKSVFYMLLFTFILRCTPTSMKAINYYLKHKLGFNWVDIGYMSMVGGIAFLISIIIIIYYSRTNRNKFNLRKLFLWWTIIASIVPFIILIVIFKWNQKLGIPDIYFMIFDTIIVYTSYDILQMAINILYARICPPGIEGVFVSVLTTISNIGLMINLQISSFMTSFLGIKCNDDDNEHINITDSVICDFRYLWLWIIIVNISKLIPLILINKLPNEKELIIIGNELKNCSLDKKNENYVYSQFDKSKMIKCFWNPFIRNKICCCLCNKLNIQKKEKKVINTELILYSKQNVYTHDQKDENKIEEENDANN